MKSKAIKVGFLEENCYLLEKENQILIIDPGDDFSKIKREVGSNNVLGVLITHKHFDHIGALKDVIMTYNCPIYEKKNVEEKKYEIGPFSFSVIYTPGHSEDSITYYFEEENSMFVGDFLFEGTIGRCDLPSGNERKMKESLMKICKYNDVNIYPGHGNSTTLFKEKMDNPYLENIKQ